MMVKMDRIKARLRTVMVMRVLVDISMMGNKLKNGLQNDWNTGFLILYY
jgi:hypothetical protein